MPAAADLDELRRAWALGQDGESGSALADALEAGGDLDAAAAVWQRIWELGYPSGYYGLAWLERGRGDVPRAIDLMQQAVDSQHDDPGDDDLNLYLGILGHWRWRFLGRLDAEPALRRGQHVFPEARADLANLLKASGDLGQAEEILREGVALTEDPSFLPLANLLDESDRSAEAERLYRLGYALGDPFCAYNLGIMLDRQGRRDEAVEWIGLAAAAGDELAIAWLATET